MKNSKLHRLDDVADVIDSLHQTPSYVNNGLSMVRVTDIKGGSLNLKETLKVSQKVYDEFTKKYQPKIGDLLMTRVGSYGTCSYINTEEKFCLGQNTVVIKPKVDSEFLYYCLIAGNVKSQIESFVTGSTQKTISLKNIRSLEIPMPSNEKILFGVAKTLADLDKKIELNNKINTELEAMAKLIYDYWFVQFDFPDANGKPYKTSGGKMVYNEVLKREIPDGWANGVLNNLGEIVGGSTPSTKNPANFSKNGTPWITPKDLSKNVGNKFITKGEQDVSAAGIKSASLKTYPKNTVLMSSRAPIGYMAIARDGLTTNQGFKSFIPNKGFSSDFIFYSVKNSMKAIIQYSSGSTFKEVSGAVLKTVKTCLPKTNVSDLYSEKVASIFKRQNLLEIENQKLTELRDWLLPMLMNGQVTVKDS